MTFEVGDVIKVGEFFWIRDDDFIGYDRNAEHGHGLDKRSAGSVDKDCEVEVRGFSNGKVVVSLIRPSVPYGAPAPIGTVFMIEASKINSWGGKLVKSAEKEKKRAILAKEFCK